MSIRIKFGLLVLLLMALVGALGMVWVLEHGFSARDEPTAVEAFLARRLRHLSVPRGARETSNPVALTDAVLADARAHFADHCALCHGNDGRGETEIGRNLYPKAPDMTAPATQSLSDGELFYIIKEGVRLTGMPAWGEDTPEDDRGSWELVHFIRHLPDLKPEEIEEMKLWNPRSRRELEQEEEIRRFLEGEDLPSEPPQHKH